MNDPVSAISRYAAVELGSDSFRLHVGRIEQDELVLEATLSERVALPASFAEDGSLCEAAMRRALECLREFARTLDAWRPREVRVVATSALRVARNAALFLPAAEAALRRPIELVAGDESGRLVYLGVTSTLDPTEAPRLVLDIGGASTELVVGCGAHIERIESFPVGALRQSLSFFAGGAIDRAAFDAAVRSGRSRFAETALAGRRWEQAWGACGTVRALSEIASDNGRLTAHILLALRERFLAAGHVAQVRQAWPAAARVPHLAGGLALLLALVEECGIGAVVPVHAGLRVGALWDLHRRAAGLETPGAACIPARSRSVTCPAGA